MSARFPRVPGVTWLVVLLGLAPLSCSGSPASAPGAAPEAAAAEPASYLFCFWNVENLFDDMPNKQAHPADKEYDEWFAQDAQARRLKYEHLGKALAEMNDGKGPDILAVAEVESERAAQLLREAVNQQLRDPRLHYTNVLFKDPHGGRHIATAILTRLPVNERKTQLIGRRMRILEGHIEVNGQDLTVLATHWTSRVSDKEGEGRDKYADLIYGRFRAMYRTNPAVDFLVCGDFNDPPDEDSVVKHLHGVADPAAVRQARDEPLLLSLFGNKDPQKFGTHWHNGHWYIFDQILVSAGMLDDRGWTCEVGTARTVNSLTQPRDRVGRPWRFGSERDKFPRGYSDHFPVTVRLRVQGT
jgi:endonuclease/exonuclease/phosphatase family metal-dependent hydrolase